MWMNTSCADWAVEAEVRDRISSAMHEAEQGRLARTAQSAGRRNGFGSRLSAIRAGLSLVACRATASFQGLWPWVDGVSTPQHSC